MPNLLAGIDLLQPLWRFASFRKVSLKVEIVETKGFKPMCSCSRTQLLDKRDDEEMRSFFALRLGKVEVVKAEDCFRIAIDPRGQAEAIAWDVEK